MDNPDNSPSYEADVAGSDFGQMMTDEPLVTGDSVVPQFSLRPYVLAALTALVVGAIWIVVLIIFSEGMSGRIFSYLTIAVGAIVGAVALAQNGGRRSLPLGIVAGLLTALVMGIGPYLVIRHFAIVDDGLNLPLFMPMDIMVAAVQDFYNSDVLLPIMGIITIGIAFFIPVFTRSKR